MLIFKNDWNDVMNKTTCGDAFGTFYVHIKSCYNQAFPLIRMSKNPPNMLLGWLRVSELQPE